MTTCYKLIVRMKDDVYGKICSSIKDLEKNVEKIMYFVTKNPVDMFVLRKGQNGKR